MKISLVPVTLEIASRDPLNMFKDKNTESISSYFFNDKGRRRTNAVTHGYAISYKWFFLEILNF
jgi:hypothetical protein